MASDMASTSVTDRTPSNSDDDDSKLSNERSFVSPESTTDGTEGWVKDPTENDVLCGRGGSINSHPGNERFRQLVEKRKRIYLTARFKREKRLIANSIVSEIRGLDPPGRFLAREAKSGKWKDIGDEKARDKTSQALRENAPSIRAEIETEINEQRKELQREEEEAARANAAQGSHPYYQGWGYYYGYPPPPPHPHGHAPPPVPHPGYHPGPYEGHWGPPHGYPPPPPGHPYPPPPPKSALDKTAELVTSGAETIKSWTKGSLSLGGSSTNSVQDTHSRASSKPISYVHEGRKRRMVKFREDSKHSHRHSSSQRSVHSHSLAENSLVDDEMMENANEGDIEPQKLDAAENSSLMNQVANHILNSFGSFDTSTICGYENSDDRVPFPRSPRNAHEEELMEEVPVEDMAVEWEGQEVQLVDNSDDNSERRMPPPPRRRPVPDQVSSTGFSSLGSCHSWLPDQLNGAASFFSFSKNEGTSPCASMDMEYSAVGTENFSAAGSLGGGSLSRVFENETLEEPITTTNMPASPNMSQRVLNQMPSWERSVRSRSPLSISSGDDESLISKTSSKLSETGISPVNSGDNNMAWETKE